MSRKDFNRIGEEIRKSVEDAIDSIPYDQIGKKTAEGVERTWERIREEFDREREKCRVKPPLRKKHTGRGSGEEADNFHQGMGWQQRKWGQEEAESTKAKKGGRGEKAGKAKMEKVFSDKPKGRIIWFFFLFFGLFLACTAGISLFLLLFMNLFAGAAIGLTAAKTLWLIFLFALGGCLMFHGCTIRKRIRRFQTYKECLQGKEYCQLEVLGRETGRSVRYLNKDLGKMIALGMFPQGHLDQQGTCLMLTARSYEQYQMMLEAQARKKEEEKEKAEKKQQEEKQKQQEESQRFAQVDEGQREELVKVIHDGEGYLRRFGAMSEKLAGEEIHKKLARLCLITGRIFEFITDHPNQLGDIKKFMSYYLPTTEKLLSTYGELYMEPVQGENIARAKGEILDTLDTINYAFEHLLDSLYEDTRMDISTDIAVLETMLAQEGLTEQDF